MNWIPSQICVRGLQQMPVSAFVVGDESFYLVVNLLVSQEHSLYPCYLGEIDMAEKQDKFDTNCVCIGTCQI